MNNELWEQWSDCHQSQEQQKRMARAQTAACTPVGLDRDMGAGVFKGSSGTHTTTLEHCTCVDFCRRKLPCKHMYRLAMELGLTDLSFKSDSVAVMDSIKEPLSETVERIETLTKSQQRLFREIIWAKNSKDPISVTRVSSNLQPILDAQLLIPFDDLPTILSGYKMAELRSLIASLGSDFKATKKVDLINYLLENHSDQLKSKKLAYAAVKLSPRIKYGKVKWYLDRKLNQEKYLPDDDVTALLIQHGHYHR